MYVSNHIKTVIKNSPARQYHGLLYLHNAKDLTSSVASKVSTTEFAEIRLTRNTAAVNVKVDKKIYKKYSFLSNIKFYSNVACRLITTTSPADKDLYEFNVLDITVKRPIAQYITTFSPVRPPSQHYYVITDQEFTPRNIDHILYKLHAIICINIHQKYVTAGAAYIRRHMSSFGLTSRIKWDVETLIAHVDYQMMLNLATIRLYPKIRTPAITQFGIILSFSLPDKKFYLDGINIQSTNTLHTSKDPVEFAELFYDINTILGHVNSVIPTLYVNDLTAVKIIETGKAPYTLHYYP